MFQRFYPNATEQMVSNFLHNLPANRVTMAELQGHLVLHKQSPQLAIDNVDQFLKSVQTW